MNFIKIDDTLINLDNVIRISKSNDNRIDFEMNVTEHDEPFFYSFIGVLYPQALAAYEWLTNACVFDANTVDPQPASDEASDAQSEPGSYRVGKSVTSEDYAVISADDRIVYEDIDPVSCTDIVDILTAETARLRQRIAELEFDYQVLGEGASKVSQSQAKRIAELEAAIQQSLTMINEARDKQFETAYASADHRMKNAQVALTSVIPADER